jgi:hypothetical protein
MKMISLYDYLGRAGGPELGAKTTAAAVSMGIQLETRYVETKGYKGNVMLYPENFLKLYFQANG